LNRIIDLPESVSFRPRKPRPKFRLKPKGGAPKGNRNAFKHGGYAAKTIALKRRVRSLRRYAFQALKLVKAGKYGEFAALAADRQRPSPK